MKIAVTCENGQVFPHFGRTAEFAVFEIAGGKVVSEGRLGAGGAGHGALATVLADAQVETLICGGIGGGAVAALANAGVKVIGGAEGAVRAVAEAFAAGNLQTRNDYHCQHHHHEEGQACGDHGCGGGGCGH